MSAPQELKDALLRLLDEAYDSDSAVIDRVEVVSGSFAFYGDGEPPEMPPSIVYKIVADASAPNEIVLRLRTRVGPVAWPE